MLLAQALTSHWLGRDWRRVAGREERLQLAIIRLFSDLADPAVAPLSLHSLVAAGRTAGKVAGDWYGPHTTAHLLAQVVNTAGGAGAGLLAGVAVYTAQDCTVYHQSVLDLATTATSTLVETVTSDADTETADFSIIDVVPDGNENEDVEIDGETWCLERTSSVETSAWKSLIILIPVRLGSDCLNPIYSSCLKNLLTLESCVGIIGGKPKHALYFIGFQDEDLIHLDPHRLQDRVDTLSPSFTPDSYYCPTPRKLQLGRVDPSCCVGFYLSTRAEYEAWRENVASLVTPGGGYPLFTVAEGRGEAAATLSPQNSITTSLTSTPDLETEEFVFL